jgi:protein-disulfide isomerase
MMTPAALSRWVLVVVMLLAGRAAAQPKGCDALRGAERTVARAVLSSERAYGCCHDTLAKCLKKTPVCPLVTRLVEDVCRRAAVGTSRTDIEQELKRRAASALGPKHLIDLTDYSSKGEPSAPVTIVVYACPRCPLCARTVPALYESVMRGRLKGKAKLFVKPFPIRTHEHSAVAAKAWMAGRELGRYWELLLAMYADFDQFSAGKLAHYAAAQGMDRERFRALLEDRVVRDKLTNSKKEGVRNSVDATPAIFIDGRRYLATADLPTLEDFVEERIERAAGR